MLNESIALVRMFSIGPLLFVFLTKFDCYLDGTIELEWPVRSLLFLRKLI